MVTASHRHLDTCHLCAIGSTGHDRFVTPLPLPTRPSRRSALAGLVACAALGGCEPPRAKGALRIGSSPTGVPFSFVDPATNALTGSMIDMAMAVTASAGIPADTAITPFAALISSLLTRRIDLIAAAMLRTPEREKIVAFSEPLYDYGGGLVVRRDAGPFRDLAAVQRLRVGAQVGTRFTDQLTEAGVADVATYESLSDVLRDLDHGRLDAGYGDEPVLAYQLRVRPREGLRLAREFVSPGKEALCLIMRRGDPVMARVNEAIGRLKDTRLATIRAHWGLDG
ncbi:polar amino acid transport system substrate-binding protein [Sphingomonas jinjuensis]|uniref:Polar amino acid transport system substrate-binding protein n=1 Tax=Sphingomonas jinjuensis TaxID=535907 RepID=A0A840F824_9SPHN|nr:ABC transporter substrate-binding protein [Sphingomonas jinjuensis]MBB4152752.1 polar amino acid transport system substrate-binding protein [Sphingomonas jinjuensis]